ncbi:dihydrodipicolinate reductase [Bradyrhizobium sp. LTSPM299]|nr:dihydrodipicolinate reductase [Bradyrhizobium sp. LTSPM299]
MSSPPEPATRKPLTPAAQRALAEAEARRKAADESAGQDAAARPKEFQGPKGPEPTRYGDWETKGIASDF